MDPQTEGIVAIVGAAAWIPQIVQWVVALFTRPKVRVVSGATAEIGFNPLGPIVNLTLAISAQKRDALIMGARLIVEHSTGERHEFEWKVLQQEKGEMNVPLPGPGSLQFRTSDPAIALQVSTKETATRKIFFREPAFEESFRERERAAIEQFNHTNVVRAPLEDFLKSRQFTEGAEWVCQQMPWRTGRYKILLRLTIDGVSKPVEHSWSFELHAMDIRQMDANVSKLQDHFKALFVNDYKATGGVVAPEHDLLTPVTVWNWIYPRVTACGK